MTNERKTRKRTKNIRQILQRLPIALAQIKAVNTS